MENMLHRVSMEDRSSMSLTGIEKVISFEPDMAMLISKNGRLKITGRELHVINLDMDKGMVDLQGRIDALSYSDRTNAKDGSLIKRMFK